MEQSELNLILDQHRLWIDGKGGKCANLRGANLRGANLNNAYLWGAHLMGANLRGANLYGAKLNGAKLNGASLHAANLNAANLNAANLNAANLNGAKLTRANLHGADLEGANLIGANLEGANLSDANLTNTILPDISWIIPGCLVQLNKIKHYGFWLMKEAKYDNFVQDSFGFIIQDNREEKTFDMLVEDRIIRGIPDWVKYSGLKQIESV